MSNYSILMNFSFETIAVPLFKVRTFVLNLYLKYLNICENVKSLKKVKLFQFGKRLLWDNLHSILQGQNICTQDIFETRQSKQCKTLGLNVVPWWCHDDAMMIHWLCAGDALMMRSWCADDALMMCWWCAYDALMMRSWCTDDALMMHWWCGNDAMMMR